MDRIESWDDDFAEQDVVIPQQMQQTPLHEQLDVVKGFATTISEIEQVLVSIPSREIAAKIDQDPDDTILKALDLVAISKQDYKDKFFDTPIGQEYLTRNKTKEGLEFLRNDESEDQVNVDLNTVKRLAQRASELLPKLQRASC